MQTYKMMEFSDGFLQTDVQNFEGKNAFLRKSYLSTEKPKQTKKKRRTN